MKNFLSALLIISIMSGAVYSIFNVPVGFFPFLKAICRMECIQKPARSDLTNLALKLLKTRKDNDALAVFEKILSEYPQDIDASWGKAEILRRSSNDGQAEDILQKILSKKPMHIPSLLSISSIRYDQNKLDEALNFTQRVLSQDCSDKDNLAMAYVMLGSINGKRAINGGFFQKIKYGPKIKGYFLKAEELAPGLSEVHLALGTFYLLAPKVVGGNLNEAVKELELAVNMTQDLAIANIRLAQAYNKKGDLKKCDFYLKRAKELDPKNALLQKEF